MKISSACLSGFIALASTSTFSFALNKNVNFAFGGARSGDDNALGAFAPDLAAAINATGLQVLGLSQQLEFAKRTLFDVDSEADLFWLFAGTNDYLGGATDPVIAPERLGKALEQLYHDMNARTIVVPNLPNLGRLPVINTFPVPADDIPNVRVGLTQLTQAHNAILEGVIAGFQQERPDAKVILVDIYSNVEEQLATNKTFTEVEGSCVQDALPAGETCDGYFFIDLVHPTTAAITPIALEVATQITAEVEGKQFRRIVTLGDSLSDTGNYNDLLLRSVGFTTIPSPPYLEGRFSDGLNIIDQLEVLLGTETTSPFFVPLTATVLAEGSSWFWQWIGQLSGTTDQTGEYIVPGYIPTADRRRIKIVFNTDNDKITCTYNYDGSLGYCSNDLKAGGRISGVESVDVTANGWWLFFYATPSIQIDFLYY